MRYIYFFITIFSISITAKAQNAQSQTVGKTPETGSNTTIDPQDKIAPSGLLYHCTDNYVKQHYFQNYGIQIFVQFPDYPHVSISGNDELDYMSYKKAVEEYMAKHRDLYELMKAAESKKQAQQPQK